MLHDAELVRIPQKTPVLFAMSDPRGLTKLDLTREVSRIKHSMAMGLASLPADQRRVELAFEILTGTTVQDLASMIVGVKPVIVHISGHGISDNAMLEWKRESVVTAQKEYDDAVEDTKAGALTKLQQVQRDLRQSEGGLCLEGYGGELEMLAGESFADLIEPAGTIEGVIMNACYSATFAQPLLAHVKWVVAMAVPIGDAAAISLASAFYGALVQGLTVNQAFKRAKAAARSTSLSDKDVPQLIVRDGLDANTLFLFDPKRLQEVPPQLAALGVTSRSSSTARLAAGQEADRSAPFVNRDNKGGRGMVGTSNDDDGPSRSLRRR